MTKNKLKFAVTLSTAGQDTTSSKLQLQTDYSAVLNHVELDLPMCHLILSCYAHAPAGSDLQCTSFSCICHQQKWKIVSFQRTTALCYEFLLGLCVLNFTWLFSPASTFYVLLTFTRRSLTSAAPKDTLCINVASFNPGALINTSWMITVCNMIITASHKATEGPENWAE